jgi:peptide/nickel transport system substrate-binding protein
MKFRQLFPSLALQLLLLVGAEAQTLRVGLAEDPDILDPATARLFVSRVVLANVCDRLFYFTPDKQIAPQLATGYSWSDDNRTLTLELRPNVRFHDGEPFNAAAVKYNIERSLTLPGSLAKQILGPTSNVEIVDDLKVKIRLTSPHAPLLPSLTNRVGMMVSPRSAEAAGKVFANRPICAGPYKFVERVPQERIVLERFGDYWDKGNIFIDRVIYRPIPDSTVLFANLRSGDLDLIERMAPHDYADIGAYPRLKGASVAGFGWYYYIVFNVDNGTRAQAPLGRDPRVREAFELALDRGAINEIVFNGQHVPTNQWLAPDDPYYAQNLPLSPRNVARARELLNASGTPRVSIELMNANIPVIKQLAEVIQEMTREAGFDVRLRPVETASAYQMSRKGDFDAFVTGFNPYGDPDVFINPLVSCDGTFNEGHYCNGNVDHILAEARSRLAPEDRKRLYADVASIVLSDRPVIFLLSRRILYGYTARLTGFQPNPDGFIHLQGMKLISK